MDKTANKLEKDIAALNFVFRDYEKYIGTPTRYFIDIMNINGKESVVVWDAGLNRVTYNFGDTTYYSKLMTKYAVLPAMFSKDIA